MNYWVLSPNVLDNPKEYPIKSFLSIMNKEHIAIIGYNKDDNSGIDFYYKIKKGDIIIIAHGYNYNKRNYFTGIVDSEAYEYIYKNRKLQARKLIQFSNIQNENISWNAECTFGSARPKALYQLKYKNENDKKIIFEILNIIKQTKEKENMEKYTNLLKENYNLILTGAPGTGKTYLAKEIAAKIIFDDDKKEYTEELEKDENFKNQYEFVQFHPSYDYTDFVEGLRPINNNGNIGFERKDGVFKEFCKKALKNLIEIESIIIKEYLIKFKDDVSNIIANEEKFEIDGISRKAASIKFIEINSDNSIHYKLNTDTGKHEVSIPIDTCVEMYRDLTSKDIYSLDYNDVKKLKHFDSLHTYKYGFLKAFYEKYNSQIKKEVNTKKKNCVFIIDEINRGEVSKIFGELFFAIDPGYRGIKGKVLTQYSNLIDEELEKYFYIPENVYIIGTMNDIDRSVESMDFAMRRRFAWREVKAIDTQESILKDLDDSIKQDAIDRMNNLNKAIYDEEKKTSICELSSAYHIGASYFLKLKNYYNGNNKEDAFKSLWDNHLKGLLFEYLRGMPDINDKLIKLENAYDTVSSNTSQTGGTAQSGNTLQTNSTTQTSNITQDNDTN